MPNDVLLVADRHSWVTWWDGPKIAFEEVAADRLAAYRAVVLAPGEVKYQATCKEIFGWKRAGLLNDTRLVLGTYKGRHIWTPEDDALVDRWVVHGRSERRALDSDRLAFVPLCLMKPRTPLAAGDDGFLFMGGRKWRALDAGMAALAAAGYPAKVITDFAPEGDHPNIDVRRERIPKGDYIEVMARARAVIVPLKETPVSHGQVEVVTAIMVGRPVLVTAGASCDDYVQHGVNGLLVQGNSVEAWTDAIHEAWEKAEDFAAAAREMAPRYYSPMYAQYIRAITDSLV